MSPLARLVTVFALIFKALSMQAMTTAEDTELNAVLIEALDHAATLDDESWTDQQDDWLFTELTDPRTLALHKANGLNCHFNLGNTLTLLFMAMSCLLGLIGCLRY